MPRPSRNKKKLQRGGTNKPATRSEPSEYELENTVLRNILRKFRSNTDFRRHTKASRQWFKDYVRKTYSKLDVGRLGEGAKSVKRPVYGKMYMFMYNNPKHKDKLPYYDALPLVFFFNIGKNDHGLWYGINLHYLPPVLRLKLFEDLLRIRTKGRMSAQTKVKLTWQRLQSLTQHPLVKPTVHAYIPSRIGAGLAEIDPRVWEIVISLPTEKFRKASRKAVWADSRSKM